MEYIKSDVFKGKRVLITGHTGFKGSWLTMWLTRLGAKVIGLSLDSGHKNGIFNLSQIGKDIIDIRGDIRDGQKIKYVFETYKPEIIFHLAAQPLVKYSYQYPKDTYSINVMGTLNILEEMRKYSEPQIGIFVTSDKCYQNNNWDWGYREIDPMGGIDPYSSSKGCCELLISSYRDSYFNTQQFMEHQKVLATVRAGNVIGGGDWAVDRIIPDVVKAIKDKQDIIVRSPHAIRPWQHVLEALSGYLILASKLLEGNIKYSGAWNFGPHSHNGITVKELVENIFQHWGYSGSWKLENNQTTFYEAKILNLDISKANRLLQWFPRWDIYETIEKTTDWYKIYETVSIRELCYRQINEYCNF
ncbi:CDP-glucose 4,6-dehydratase [Bacillus cereus]|uniref:CDP-glucose 4,6-dehydratase n=1 Tax=Bacillus cereus TaxID=1396 RepID=UPI0011A32054|nr:CDP-glucose 4,6-dehydratase [Bacillus cereus]